MKNGNVIQEKSYVFALRTVKLCRYLMAKKKEYVLSRQVLRSGTSIGANVEEAIGGRSGKDFFVKMCVAYKEARETHYWLRLLRDSGYLTEAEISSMIVDCEEILKLSGSIIKTMKRKRGI
jgi:four helix bundle protein